VKVREAGMEVLEAGSGEEALDVVPAEPVDVAVVDHSMPGMSGLELIPRLKAVVPELHVVGFTSAPDAANAFLRAGACRHFTKPQIDPLIGFLTELSADGPPA
jgi:CheY-like chemotaxis protein